jgi:starch synthase
MKILLASSEVHPYSKTGGLADMAGALGKYLALAGHKVGIVTPLYRGVREKAPALKKTRLVLKLPLGRALVRADVLTLEAREGLTFYFVDQPLFYDRPALYQEEGVDYADNPERFIFFAKCVAHLARHLSWRPEILHLHDWQAALAPLFLAHQKWQERWMDAPRTCLTIHNLAYQGIFPAPKYELTNLPWHYFNSKGVEFYGQMNCLKAGLVYADSITTVSPRYAREISTEEYGCGLDGVLRERGNAVVGILNGVDYSEWNTDSNPYLVNPFTADDLSGKTAAKLELQRELGLTKGAAVPLFGAVTRLVDQKGTDLLLSALEEMLSGELQFVLLGSGEPRFERAFERLAARHPGQVAVKVGYDHALPHRIEAASDFFLMPSRFEPCGLNQMYSLRYGAIPIVRATGGLDDSVVDIREDSDRANGIKFHEYSAGALAKAMRKALVIYGQAELLSHYRRNAMQTDFSWTRTAGEYLAVFKKLRE